MESPISNRGLNLKAHKILPRRRVTSSPNALENKEKNSRRRKSSDSHREEISSWIESASPTLSTTNQHLPLTPPSLPEDTFNKSSQQPIIPEVLEDERLVDDATPVGQMSPPTPDLTPPRMKMREKTSQRYPSSAADSFKTAREFATSEDSLHRFSSPESDLSTVIQVAARSSNSVRVGAMPLSTYARNIGLGLGFDLKRDGDSTIIAAIPEHNHDTFEDVLEDPSIAQETAAVKEVDMENLAKDELDSLPERLDSFSGSRDRSLLLKQRIVSDRLESHRRSLNTSLPNEDEPRKSTEVASHLTDGVDSPVESVITTTDQPLVIHSQIETSAEMKNNTSSPVEPLVTVVDQIENAPIKEFGTLTERCDTENCTDSTLRRLSHLSTTSGNVIEAIVITPPRQKRQKLRKSIKNYSLRDTTSSGNHSNRSSLNSAHQNHVLRHKLGNLRDNPNRASLNSDSGISMGYDAFNIKDSSIPLSEVPQRRSSLRGHRKNISIATKGKERRSSRPITAPERLMSPTGEIMSQMRPIFDARPHSLYQSPDSRGREVGHAPPVLVPPRSSSLSAPTSQSNSRSGSMASDNRKLQTQRPHNPHRSSSPHIRISIPDVEPSATTKSADGFVDAFRSDEETGMLPIASPHLRASLTRTPFSIISTPGLVEFGQGTRMSLYPHKNDSVLVIEHSHEPDSLDEPLERQAKQVVSQSPDDQRRQRTITPKEYEGISSEEMRRNISATSTSASLPMNSPSRPSHSDKIFNIARTPSGRRQSQSFITPLSRLPSITKSTPARRRIMIDDQSNTLSQFWRPDGFWNDLSDSEDELDSSSRKDTPENTHVVRNTLGLPSRPIMAGPTGLARRLGSFKRRKQMQDSPQNTKQSSPMSSLHNGSSIISSGFDGTPTKRRHSFSLTPITSIYDNIHQKRTDRAEAQKEKKRQKLKQLIGPAILRDSARQF